MYVGLDLATRSGVAFWLPAWDKPRSLVLRLPEGDDGAAFAKLHLQLAELHRTVAEIKVVACEQPMVPQGRAGETTFRTIGRLIGLHAHAQSFAHAVRARFWSVNQSSWRKHFLGRGAGADSATFKACSVDLCRRLGWNPPDHNAADALGVLDYGIHLDRLTPPWTPAAMVERAANPVPPRTRAA